eukprot:966960-Rhodomonas_salina.1
MMIKGVRAAAARTNHFHSSRDSGFFGGSQVLKRDPGSVGLPPSSHWLASAVVKKRVVIETTSWQDRRLTLTKDYVFLSRTEGREVAESIPLDEVTTVETLRAPAAEDAEEDKKLPRRLNRSNSNRSNTKSETQLSNLRSLRPSTSLRGPGNPVGDEELFLFEIRTKIDGMMNGRSYCIRCSSRQETD